MEQPAILAKVRDILKTEFPLLASMDLQPKTALLSAGLLDSFATITLLSALETSFGINLDINTLELSEFENMETITNLCARSISKM